MFVDDDRALLAALSRLTHQWSVVAAPDLGTAKQSVLRCRPDLALIDMVLPDGCGIDLIAELRASDPDIWLVLVSGHNSVDSTVRAMRAGADDVVCKPFTLSEISRRLHHDDVDLAPLQAPTITRVTWEHVQRIYEETGRNKSEAARQLGIDRNTLKRWLGMPAPNG